MKPDDQYLRESLQSEFRAASWDYHGRTVRNLFVSIAMIMLITLPYLHKDLPTSFIFSIIGTIVVGICAGITSSRFKWSLFVDVAVSGIALIIFESYAIATFDSSDRSLPILILSQFLALLFFMAFYYSVVTLRRWNDHR